MKEVLLTPVALVHDIPFLYHVFVHHWFRVLFQYLPSIILLFLIYLQINLIYQEYKVDE